MNDNPILNTSRSRKMLLTPLPPVTMPGSDRGVSSSHFELHEMLRRAAWQEARLWTAAVRGGRCRILEKRLRESIASIEQLLLGVQNHDDVAEAGLEIRWLLENARLLRAATRTVRRALRGSRLLPQVRVSDGDSSRSLRAYVAASAYLRATGFAFEEDTFSLYFQAAQQSCSLEMGELWALGPLLQLVLLEEAGRAARQLLSGVKDAAADSSDLPDIRIPTIMTSLRRVQDANWKDLFEQISECEKILREDPAGAYPRMDYESRNLYREALKDLALHSNSSEPMVARAAIKLAEGAQREWNSNPRVRGRRRHVGYYLIGRGRRILEKEIGFHPPFWWQLRDAIGAWPEIYYLVGIELLTFAVIAFVLSGLGPAVPLIPAFILLLLPASESAIGVLNQLVAGLFPARILPKLDFTEGIPDDCVTMVAVPTLLIDESQVRKLVRDLEVRYLANGDRNLHFALLTDLPDAPQPSDEGETLVDLCSALIAALNDKYLARGKGSFFHFHRRRVFNSSEGAWMGWERKRGKLLDFNNLLLGRYDHFPVKTGDLSRLPSVRYVITLDSDTELPRGTAHRLVGTLAHPLNCAVVDPATNTVVEGYGILQPRVSISVRSASRSRLANIYSGHTGFDIYTRAVSNVYQDLFGEGIFTGKGIYEVRTFQQVLAERFPCNTILSHDLIEGEYARAGLVSDVEVIDDYPSHFSAYSRRKHRWVRGDWQIMRWLCSRVPDYSGRIVPNPLGVISRWKILDNLRRSVLEASIFVLILAGWLCLPGGPIHWTLAVLALLLIPTYVQLMLAVLKLPRAESPLGLLKEAGEAFVEGQVAIFLMLAFLLHQTLVTLDAIVRAVARLFVTRQKLLEWETSAQAESEARKENPVDVYLDRAPLFSILIALALAGFRPYALPIASPILVLWGCAKLLSQWLNRPLRSGTSAISAEDETFLRDAALLTWEYFRRYGEAGGSGLIPDNVQENPPAVAHRISPTNLGLLLNARLAAYRLGFLSLQRFVTETETTFATISRLARFNGHLYNWYDTRSLEPLEPRFVSTVDSGNLACCLWTLKQGCLHMGTQPIFQRDLFRSVRDHIRRVSELLGAAEAPSDLVRTVNEIASRMEACGSDASAWMNSIRGFERQMREIHTRLSQEPGLEELTSWSREAGARLTDIREAAESLTPWLLPEFQETLHHAGVEDGDGSARALTLESLPEFIANLEGRLLAVLQHPQENGEVVSAAQALRSRLPMCLREAEHLQAKLKSLADQAACLVEEMDFRFLYSHRRQVLSIGYDAGQHRREGSSYELLASEARSAVFVAIAKGDIPQESWFHLGRTHTICEGRRVLLSWTGTMFEYLMPALWMNIFYNTILERSMDAAVACQKVMARRLGIPWGISESAWPDKDEEGHYQYRAFGVRSLALKPDLPREIVVSPYSTFLALHIDPAGALKNLRIMKAMGWTGALGFYDAAQFDGFGPDGVPTFQVVPTWMTHHQGMSLLSVANLLCDGAMPKYFHAEPLVEATERLLHERVPRNISIEQDDPACHSARTSGWQPGRRDLAHLPSSPEKEGSTAHSFGPVFSHKPSNTSQGG
ncbi:MAG TPA: glucoamylase family protein [Terriglobia bacterium]|nr:glucoamylase family protein [Terriglobia bacterium]